MFIRVKPFPSVEEAEALVAPTLNALLCGPCYEVFAVFNAIVREVNRKTTCLLVIAGQVQIEQLT